MESNHNGGLLAFGPDKMLYIGTGDGGGARRPARRARQRPEPRQPARQAAAHRPAPLRRPRPTACRRATRSSAAPARAREIYSYGLRNPWRFSFDRRTGDLTIGDVGQNAVEEIDFATKGAARGANYGWRPFEGTRRNFQEPAPDAVAPVIELTHDDGNCSITGGYVVRDAGVPALLGRYVYGDFCVGRLRSAKLSAGSAQGDAAIPGLAKVEQLSSFGEDARGPRLRRVAQRAGLPARRRLTSAAASRRRRCGA